MVTECRATAATAIIRQISGSNMVRSSFSRPQRFVINYLYDLPVRQAQGASGISLNGWNVSGVTIIQDGTPMTVLDQRGGTVFGIGQRSEQRGQLCPGATYGQIEVPAGWKTRRRHQRRRRVFNTTPSARRHRGTVISADNATLFGNSGVGILLGRVNSTWTCR